MRQRPPYKLRVGLQKDLTLLACFSSHWFAVESATTRMAKRESPPPISHRDSILSEHDGEFDIDTNIQCSGMLWKKPFGGKKKQKWQRRYVHQSAV